MTPAAIDTACQVCSRRPERTIMRPLVLAHEDKQRLACIRLPQMPDPLEVMRRWRLPNHQPRPGVFPGLGSARVLMPSHTFGVDGSNRRLRLAMPGPYRPRWLPACRATRPLMPRWTTTARRDLPIRRPRSRPWTQAPSRSSRDGAVAMWKGQSAGSSRSGTRDTR